LVVEDEPKIAEVLEGYLRREGWRCERASNGEQALMLHHSAKPDLVLLDVQMPGLDGFEVLKRLRLSAATPVILLTARAEDIDKLFGLSLGADDYVVKPFNPQEVMARVKAVLRRSAQAATLAQQQHPLRLGEIELDPVSTVARKNQQRLDLTLSEFRLLEHFLRHPNRTFSRSELLEVVLPDSEALERVIDVHMGNLRKKLQDTSILPQLETVRGIGYRLWLG
jgi:two-component system, OmpR family, response regulator AdeR